MCFYLYLFIVEKKHTKVSRLSKNGENGVNGKWGAIVHQQT